MDQELREIARRAAGRALADAGRRSWPAGSPSGERRAGIHVHVEPCDAPDRPDAAAPPGSPASSRAAGPSGAARPGPEVVTARCLARVPDGGAFAVPLGALVTPMAEEEAFRRGIRLQSGPGEPRPERRGALRVAVGSDHGGFAMKADVLTWVRECGHAAVDLGTVDENPVDYPDFARRVAEAVAGGQCDYGIVVDGAGIGSAMAANKVPGVRAAMCYDEATARNAREHNYANVLSLGGRLLAPDLACRIVRTFLSTPDGPERHARRVAKITAIERDYRGRGARGANPTAP